MRSPSSLAGFVGSGSPRPVGVNATTEIVARAVALQETMRAHAWLPAFFKNSPAAAAWHCSFGSPENAWFARPRLCFLEGGFGVGAPQSGKDNAQLGSAGVSARKLSTYLRQQGSAAKPHPARQVKALRRPNTALRRRQDFQRPAGFARLMAARMNALASPASPHPCVFTHFPGSRSL